MVTLEVFERLDRDERGLYVGRVKQHADGVDVLDDPTGILAALFDARRHPTDCSRRLIWLQRHPSFVVVPL